MNDLRRVAVSNAAAVCRCVGFADESKSHVGSPHRKQPAANVARAVDGQPSFQDRQIRMKLEKILVRSTRKSESRPRSSDKYSEITVWTSLGRLD